MSSNYQKSDKICWTFCASISMSEIKQNLLIEPDGRLAAETEQDLRCHWILARLSR